MKDEIKELELHFKSIDFPKTPFLLRLRKLKNILWNLSK